MSPRVIIVIVIFPPLVYSADAWFLPPLVTGQLQEMEMIRQKVYQLEQAQLKMKQEYVTWPAAAHPTPSPY